MPAAGHSGASSGHTLPNGSAKADGSQGTKRKQPTASSEPEQRSKVARASGTSCLLPASPLPATCDLID